MRNKIIFKRQGKKCFPQNLDLSKGKRMEGKDKKEGKRKARKNRRKRKEMKSREQDKKKEKGRKY